MYFILDERWMVFIKMEQVLGLHITQHIQQKDKDAQKKLRCVHAANDLNEKVFGELFAGGREKSQSLQKINFTEYNSSLLDLSIKIL